MIMEQKFYTIIIEGNANKAFPMVKLMVELLGAHRVEIEYKENDASQRATSSNWFKVSCIEKEVTNNNFYHEN